MKHANSIIESFEYFCQISSKSIHTISSYTVSNLGRFLRHSVVTTYPSVCLFVCLLPRFETSFIDFLQTKCFGSDWRCDLSPQAD